MKKIPAFCFAFCLSVMGAASLAAQETGEVNTVETARRDTIKYGTETEIVSLIQALKNEGADYLDGELAALTESTQNSKILSGVFAFFSDREKSGLEDRAIRAIEERDDEANETVLAAIEYLGRVKERRAAAVLKELLDAQERRFMNAAFRALGRVGGAGRAEGYTDGMAAPADGTGGSGEAGDSGSADAVAETGGADESGGTKQADADEAAEYLIDYYANRDPGDENRRDIIAAVGATGSIKAVSFLSEIAGDNEERAALRIAALDSLAKIGDEGGLAAILSCVSAGDPNVRSSAVAALGPFSGGEVDRVILEAFRDSYYRSRLAAAQASRERKLEAAIPYLKYRAAQDDNPNVKDEAIRALGAIANEEAMAVLETLFMERKNSDRVRLTAAEMLVKNQPAAYLGRLIVELDEAKQKNQTPLYNGLLKVAGDARTESAESLARRFLTNGGIIEKSYGLDLAANNMLITLTEEIKALAADRNESLARKARRTAEKLGIEL
jgi:HEAT repeat protein